MNSFRDHCRKHAAKSSTTLKNKRTGVSFTLDAVAESGTEQEYRAIIADGSAKFPKANVLGGITRTETFKFEGEATRAAVNCWFDEEVEEVEAEKEKQTPPKHNRVSNGAPAKA